MLYTAVGRNICFGPNNRLQMFTQRINNDTFFGAGVISKANIDLHQPRSRKKNIWF